MLRIPVSFQVKDHWYLITFKSLFGVEVAGDPRPRGNSEVVIE